VLILLGPAFIAALLRFADSATCRAAPRSGKYEQDPYCAAINYYLYLRSAGYQEEGYG
jgi:hypothetical protein